MTKINKKQNEKKIINLFGKSYGIICNPCLHPCKQPSPDSAECNPCNYNIAFSRTQQFSENNLNLLL